MANKRIFVFAVVLFLGLATIDFFLARSRFEETKSQIALELIQSDKILSSELYRLFYGLEDDFNFFEIKMQSLPQNTNAKEDIKNLIDFLNTHPDYFKVRLTDSKGVEKFKLVQEPGTVEFRESKNLYDLSNQGFFYDLKQVKNDEFFFSSMEANIIGGKVEYPLRPTIRVSRRINLPSLKDAILIFNIDGQRILQLFQSQPVNHGFITNKSLIDTQGQFIATFPLLDSIKYTLQKDKIEEHTLKKLRSMKEPQGSFESKNDLIVFTNLSLPRTSEKWFIVTRVTEETLKQTLYHDRLKIFFWEFFCYVILLGWFWRDEKKRHREEVVQVLLKERSEFIQNVSHQLKTPLAIIYNELSDENMSSQKRLDIRQETEHLIEVVEDLLLLSQIESIDSIPMTKGNILDVINETIDFVARKAKQKSVSIRLNIQEDLSDSMEMLDKNMLPDLLKSAFINLLDNAIDYSPKNTVIEITLGKRNDRIFISIEDNGPGVSPDLAPHIFRPYVRDKSRKGSGLGLSITKKILDLHHGSIIYSRDKKGAIFEVSL